MKKGKGGAKGQEQRTHGHRHCGGLTVGVGVGGGVSEGVKVGQL